MRQTAQLLQHTARLTLFTRPNCSLCDSAKTVLQIVAKKRSFDYNEIDIMLPGQNGYKDLYEFDTPVVGHFYFFLGLSHALCQFTDSLMQELPLQLHVQRVFHTYSKPNIATEARKLMHRFTEDQVELLIDEAEGHA